MWDIKKDLQIRKEELEKIKTYAGSKLEKAPEGSLRTSLSKGLFRYYEVKESGDTKGKYINAKKSSIAKELAEKDYCIKLLKQIDKELAGIERAMKILDRSAFSYKAPSRGAGERKVRTGFAEEIYDSFNEGRRRLVVPFIISDELFARSWQQADYATGNYKPEEKIYLTKKGEFVRSKSEANYQNATNR